jgi:DHA1 family inner membrane transport protein
MSSLTGAPSPHSPSDPTPGLGEYTDNAPPASAVSVPGSADAALMPPAEVASGAPISLPASPRRAMVALLVLSATAFLFVTNEIAPLGLITLIAEDLGRSTREIGYLATAFALVVVLVSVPFAKFTTRMPRRDVLVSAAAVWTAGVLVTANSEGLAQLLAGRALTAFAHAMFWAVVTPAVAGMFMPNVRGRSVTRLMLGASAAGVVGLPASVWLAQQTAWRTPFWVLMFGGVIMTVAIAFAMPNFRSEQGTAARGELPSLRKFLRILAIVLLTMAGMATTFTYITPFVVEVGGFAANTVPVLLMIGGVVGAFSMWQVGRFLDRYPVRSVAVGSAMLVAMWAGLSAFGSLQPVVVLMLMLQGLGFSILVASLVNWAMRHAPGATDIAVAIYASVFNGGNVVGSLLGGRIQEWWGPSWLPAASLVLTGAAAFLVWRERPGLGLRRRVRSEP